METPVTTDQEVVAVQEALLSMQVIVPITAIYLWSRERRAEAVEWAIHNAAAVRTGENELLPPYDYMLPYLDDGGEAGESAGSQPSKN